MTVREAFSKAYGPIPEGATCHVAKQGWRAEPCYVHDNLFYVVNRVGGWNSRGWKSMPLGVQVGADIRDERASAYLCLFASHEWGDKYDRVVAEDQAAWRAALHGARVSVSDAEDDGS